MRKFTLIFFILVICAFFLTPLLEFAVRVEPVRKARLVLADVSGGWCTAPLTGKEFHAPVILWNEATELLGESVQTQTFSLSVGDLDGDLRDDILIGAHGKLPLLYLNGKRGFTNASQLLGQHYRGFDSHGHTLADLDDDSDLDIIVAGGGADGVGEGSPNMLLENRSENGSLNFVRESLPQQVALPAARSRTLMPIASADGSRVNLYLTALTRKGHPNTLLRTSVSEHGVELSPDTQSGFTGNLNDRGRGILADFNGNGIDDYLLVTESFASIYWDENLESAPTDLANRVYSANAADLDNDGTLDLFLGRYSAPNSSDLVTSANEGIIFSIHNNKGGDIDEVSFRTGSDSIALNLKQHVRLNDSGAPADVDDIFLGPKRNNPIKRMFTVNRSQLSGKPENTDMPGTYLWYARKEDLWWIRWVHRQGSPVYKGRIDAATVSDVAPSRLERQERGAVRDLVLLNDGAGNFTRLCTPYTKHREVTAHSTVADFDLDGWLDIVLLRRKGHGGANGDIVVLQNREGRGFAVSRLAPRPRDKLSAADLVATGFFDGDARPDLIVSNGYGQMPGNNGSLRLLLNAPATKNEGILFLLEGVSSNRQATGAKLMLRDRNDSPMGYRVQGLNTNISQDSQWVHFGLGNFEPPYTLTIEWPNSSVTEHKITQSGRYQLRQGGDAILLE